MARARERMLRIEKNSQGGTTTIRLIGHFQADYLGELKNQLEDDGPEFVLDLKEVTIVDVEVVRFLGAREAEGVKIVHCPQYIRRWMARERTGLQRALPPADHHDQQGADHAKDNI
jgi:hypothetical protein